MSHLDEGVLTALIDGEIPSRELAPIQAHLEACPECQTLLAELRDLAGETDAMITSLGDGVVSVPTQADVIPLSRGSRTRTYRLIAWAATVVLAAGAGYWARDPGIAPPADLSDGPAAFLPPVAGMEAAQDGRDAASAESVEADPGTAPAARRIAEAPVVAQTVPVAPTSPASREVPEVLGRSAVRNDLAAAKLAERLVAPPVAASRGVALQGSGAPPAAPAPTEDRGQRQEVAVESFSPIPFPEAVARMGGSLRLIDGLVPDRLEASETLVRVIYPLQAGELILEQQRVGDSITVTLRGPISADSLAVLRGRVR